MVEGVEMCIRDRAVAMFTWLKVIPTLDAQHGTAGRGKHLGENETLSLIHISVVVSVRNSL